MLKDEKLVIASNNYFKVKEIKKILIGIFEKIVSMKEIGLDIDLEETGDTFEENAILKARVVAKTANCWALADDSGLCVDALGGKPGVFSSRWSGGGDEANNKKLLKEMRGMKNRMAQYKCVMALANPGGCVLTAEGRCEGVIGHEPKGREGFGYDPLFVVPGWVCTMAELPEEEKNAISHRGIALRELVVKMQKMGFI